MNTMSNSPIKDIFFRECRFWPYNGNYNFYSSWYFSFIIGIFVRSFIEHFSHTKLLTCDQMHSKLAIMFYFVVTVIFSFSPIISTSKLVMCNGQWFDRNSPNIALLPYHTFISSDRYACCSRLHVRIPFVNCSSILPFTSFLFNFFCEYVRNNDTNAKQHRTLQRLKISIAHSASNCWADETWF